MFRRLVLPVGMCVVVTGLASLSSAAEFSRLQPEANMSNGIAYMSGGIGTDEREALQFAARDYNLKLGFAEKAGNYISDTQVTIANASGNQVLNGISHGPWFFVRLPPGNYRVMATTLGETRTQNVQVNSRQQTVVYFYW